MTAHSLGRYKKGPDEHGTAGKGCRCATCRAANAAWQRNQRRMIAYGRWEGLHDATGTQRRIQALMWNGWSMGLLSARAGCTRQTLRRLLLGRTRVAPSTAARIRVLYAGLWDQAPPARNRLEKRAVTDARRYARERGWVPPAAWDDDEIDDPAARPAGGWERGEGREYGALAEEAAELAGHGEIPEMIAVRLVASLASVERTLSRVAAKAAA